MIVQTPNETLLKYLDRIKVNDVNFELFLPILKKHTFESLDIYFTVLEKY